MYQQQAFASHPGVGFFGRGSCGGRGRHGEGAAGRRGIPPWARFFEGSWAQAPVNIETTDTSFVLTLYAAGLVKEHIQLSVQNDVLTIAYRSPAPPDGAEEAGNTRYTRREFRDPAFERTFQLNGKVLAEGIQASYAEGILTVTLPKNPAANQPAQPITVQ